MLPPKLEALCDYVLERSPRRLTSVHLAWIAFNADFEAYRQLGKSITGTVWCKGRELPFPQGCDERWAARLLRSRQPRWARVAGDLVAAALFVGSLR